MAICSRCSEDYSDRRREIGYLTCLECGAAEASKETFAKARQVAPAYNKGAYQYITSKKIAKTIGR